MTTARTEYIFATDTGRSPEPDFARLAACYEEKERKRIRRIWEHLKALSDEVLCVCYFTADSWVQNTVCQKLKDQFEEASAPSREDGFGSEAPTLESVFQGRTDYDLMWALYGPQDDGSRDDEAKSTFTKLVRQNRSQIERWIFSDLAKEQDDPTKTFVAKAGRYKLLHDQIFGAKSRASLFSRLTRAVQEKDIATVNDVLQFVGNFAKVDESVVFGSDYDSEIQHDGGVPGKIAKQLLSEKESPVIVLLKKRRTYCQDLRVARRNRRLYGVCKGLRFDSDRKILYPHHESSGGTAGEEREITVKEIAVLASFARTKEFNALKKLLSLGSQDPKLIKAFVNHTLYKSFSIDALVELICEGKNTALALEFLKTGIFYNLRNFRSNELTAKHFVQLVDAFSKDEKVLKVLCKNRIFGRDYGSCFSEFSAYKLYDKYSDPSSMAARNLNGNRKFAIMKSDFARKYPNTTISIRFDRDGDDRILLGKDKLKGILRTISDDPQVIAANPSEGNPYTLIRRGTGEPRRYEVFYIGNKSEIGSGFSAKVYRSLGTVVLRDEEIIFNQPSSRLTLEVAADGTKKLVLDAGRRGVVAKVISDSKYSDLFSHEIRYLRQTGRMAESFVGGILLADGGQDLHDFLVDLQYGRATCSFEERVKIMFDILQRVVVLHKQGLLHLDLKKENITLRKYTYTEGEEEKERWVVDLIDFAFTQQGEKDEGGDQIRLTGGIKELGRGTIQFLPPEFSAVLKLSESEGTHTFDDARMIDSFALASVFAYLFGCLDEVEKDRMKVDGLGHIKELHLDRPYNFSQLFYGDLDQRTDDAQKDAIRAIIEGLGNMDSTQRFTPQQALERLVTAFPFLRERIPVVSSDASSSSTARVLDALPGAGVSSGDGGGPAGAPVVAVATDAGLPSAVVDAAAGVVDMGYGVG